MASFGLIKGLSLTVGCRDEDGLGVAAPFGLDQPQFWVKVANFGKEYLYKEKDLDQDQGAMEDF